MSSSGPVGLLAGLLADDNKRMFAVLLKYYLMIVMNHVKNSIYQNLVHIFYATAMLHYYIINLKIYWLFLNK